MKKIKCKYIFKDDYNPIYVNGAQGGISPNGDIIVNFYLERGALPISQTFEINEESGVAKENETEPKDLNNSFVRVVENGIIINYQTAKELYNWLGDNIEKLEEITKNLENTKI